MMDDNRPARPHAETPDFPIERTELPEWRQVPEPGRGTDEPGGRAAPERATEQLHHQGTHGAGDPEEPGAAAAPEAPPPRPVLPPPSGPAWGTIAFGTVCLAVAAVVLGIQLTEVEVDWRYAAPLGVAGIGALLVLVGLIGLAGRRRAR